MTALEERLERIVRGAVVAAKEQGRECGYDSLQAALRGDKQMRRYYEGEAAAFRRVAKELEAELTLALLAEQATEDHEFDETPADFVDAYRLADGPLEEAA